MYPALPLLQENLKFSEPACNTFPNLTENILDTANNTGPLSSYCINGISFSAGANNDLGILYCLGTSVEQNLHKGYASLIRAADMGSAEAVYNLALLDHFGLRPEDIKATGSFFQAEKKGIKVANYYLGKKEEDKRNMVAGYDRAKDHAEAAGESRIRAIPYYKISAGVNHIPSLIRLAEIYRDELDIIDTSQAMEYSLKAADVGSIKGMMIAGELFLTGYCPRVVDPLRQNSQGYTQWGPYNHWFSNSQEKVHDLRKLIKKNNIDIPSAVNMFKSAQMAGSISACKRLGDIYLGHLQDAKKAIDYYQIGMEQNDYMCALALALIYEIHAEYKDIPKAISYYSTCVEIVSSLNPRPVYAAIHARATAQQSLKRLSQ